MLDCREALFGGSAGGGKSQALLMAALQYVDVPGYNALLLRKTFKDLMMPEALIDRARAWLAPTDARWRASENKWIFPSGASLSFGYLDAEADVYQFQSAAFQFVGLDELTQFGEFPYRYLFSRLRRLRGLDVPIRMRSASNPGGVGHEWVKQRFLVEGREAGRIFIPARLEDNPYLDTEEYEKSLAELDPVTRAQLRRGDWSARRTGGLFKREWFAVVDQAPAEARRVRFWDLAATEPKKGRDPDWTVGVRMATLGGQYWVEDVVRTRSTPKGVEDLMKVTAAVDGRGVAIRTEQEPGASGKAMIDHLARTVLPGHDFLGVSPTGSKDVRANPVSAAAQNGNIKLVEGPWLGPYLDELESFPGPHDDQVDATSGAFAALAQQPGGSVLGFGKAKGWQPR